MILPVEILEVVGKHLEHEEYKIFKKTSIYNNLPFEQFVSFETYSKALLHVSWLLNSDERKKMKQFYSFICLEFDFF